MGKAQAKDDPGFFESGLQQVAELIMFRLGEYRMCIAHHRCPCLIEPLTGHALLPGVPAAQEICLHWIGVSEGHFHRGYGALAFDALFDLLIWQHSVLEAPEET
jgi:hypothetical protein